MKVILKLSSETMRLKRRGVSRGCVMNFTSGSVKLVNDLYCGDYLKPIAELGSIKRLVLDLQAFNMQELQSTGGSQQVLGEY